MITGKRCGVICGSHDYGPSPHNACLGMFTASSTRFATVGATRDETHRVVIVGPTPKKQVRKNYYYFPQSRCDFLHVWSPPPPSPASITERDKAPLLLVATASPISVSDVFFRLFCPYLCRFRTARFVFLVNTRLFSTWFLIDLVDSSTDRTMEG
ncbi:hypothetical protein BHE74_00033688 [Ensete ventricosum]|nr:hypothetical protein BHE74_00033688 [Ensete ventricosum]RZR89021.1 hypothetical protein BHM03_00016687 [Ensete ventricosum]